MDNKLQLKEKDIQKKLLIAIGLASIALLLTILDLSFDFLLALVAYLVMAVAVVKKDGVVGIVQVILVFPTIYLSIKKMFSDDSVVDNTGEDGSPTPKLERLANFTMFYTAVIIIVTIVYPVIRLIWKIFT